MKRGKFGLPVNRKAVSMVLLICLIITLSACGNDAGGSAQTTDHSSSQKPLQSEDVTVDEQAQTTAPEDTRGQGNNEMRKDLAKQSAVFPMECRKEYDEGSAGKGVMLFLC